jgi:hypothetical protein
MRLRLIDTHDNEFGGRTLVFADLQDENERMSLVMSAEETTAFDEAARDSVALGDTQEAFTLRVAQRLEGLALARAWGFESPLSHHC